MTNEELAHVILMCCVGVAVIVILAALACASHIAEEVRDARDKIMNDLKSQPRTEYKMVAPPPLPPTLTRQDRTMLDPPEDESEMDDGLYDPWKQRDDDGGQGDTGFNDADRRRLRD